MTITHLFSNFSPLLRPISPSLEAAAATMSGEAFCRFTEEVRDHYAAGEFLKLHTLLEGHGVEPSMASARQLVFARMHAFDEKPAAGLLSELKTAFAKSLVIDPYCLYTELADYEDCNPEEHWTDLLGGLCCYWNEGVKNSMSPSQQEDCLSDMKRILETNETSISTEAGYGWRLRHALERLAWEYHALGRHDEAVAVLHRLEEVPDENPRSLISHCLAMGYFDEVERILKTLTVPDVSDKLALYLELADKLLKAKETDRVRALLAEPLLPLARKLMDAHPEKTHLFTSHLYGLLGDAPWLSVRDTAALLINFDLKKEAEGLLKPLAEASLSFYLTSDRGPETHFIVDEEDLDEILTALATATSVDTVASFLEKVATPLIRAHKKKEIAVDLALRWAGLSQTLGAPPETARLLVKLFKFHRYNRDPFDRDAERLFFRLGWDAELLRLTKMRVRREMREEKGRDQR